MPEFGGVAWNARPGAVVGNGWLVDSAAIGGIPFDLGSFPGASTTTISAQVDPLASGWVAIGFADSADGSYIQHGELWVLVRTNGKYVIWAVGSRLQVGDIPGIAIEGFHRVELTYDPGANTATVRINGTAVMTSQPLPSTPDIHFAGFHMFKAGDGGSKIDNFEVVVQP